MVAIIAAMSTNELLLSELEHDGRRAFYRPEGRVEAGYPVDLSALVLSNALDQGIAQAIVSITDVIGFESPGPTFASGPCNAGLTLLAVG